MYDRTFLVVSLPCFTTNFTTNSPQQRAVFCSVLPQSIISEHFTITPKKPCNRTFGGQNKEKQNNDKNIIRMPRQHMPQHNG